MTQAHGRGRLKWLGMVHYYAPGIFHTATRDVAGQPYSCIASCSRQLRSRERALSAGYKFAQSNAYPIGIAEAAMKWLQGALSRRWAPLNDVGDPVVLTRRFPLLSSRYLQRSRFCVGDLRPRVLRTSTQCSVHRHETAVLCT